MKEVEVYIDTARMGWSHMIAPTVEQLKEFARQVGVPDCYFQNKRGKNQPHYDINRKWRKPVLDAGAQLVSRSHLLTLLKQYNESKT